MAGHGRRRSLYGGTLLMSCASLRKLRSLCSLHAPSVSQWTSPCSLCPVCQRVPPFHFKYKTPPFFTQSSLLAVSHLGMWECVWECVLIPKPFLCQIILRLWPVCPLVPWSRPAVSQGIFLSLLFYQMLMLHAQGISHFPVSLSCAVSVFKSFMLNLKRKIELHW